MVGIKILVWKKGTNKAISEPDYTIEIGGGDQYDILLNLVICSVSFIFTLHTQVHNPCNNHALPE